MRHTSLNPISQSGGQKKCRLTPGGQKTSRLAPGGQKKCRLTPGGQKTSRLAPGGQKTSRLAPGGQVKCRLTLFCLMLSLSLSAQRIGPLLGEMPWGQGAPFNRHCPLYDGSKPVEVGCVATAMTQIMAYYRFPECTRDTLFGWTTDHIVADTIMPGAPIDWDNVREDYRLSYSEAEAEAVAWLSLYAATAVRMNFGTASSGANTSLYVTELPRVFGYRSCIECDRAFYTQNEWRRLIINEIENGRPVLYTGHNMDLSGHAFVVDGYDFETGRFHANWGYDGDFNRWVDIDVMGQFEHPDDPTHLGRCEALHCNHTVLLIHPTEELRPAADSIEWNTADVTIDKIQPATPTLHTEGYELLDITFTNHRCDTLNYTFEVLSNELTDTALFQQADYVALGSVILYPGQTLVYRTPARFSKSGIRVLSLSNDDVNTYCPTTVSVAEGKEMSLTFSDVRLLYVGSDEVRLAVDINTQGDDVAGTLITYCLFPEDSNEDWRHWQILPSDAPQMLTDTVRFTHLEPSTRYTFKVRWPWSVKAEYEFVTSDPSSDAIESITSSKRDWEYYDLSGRRLPQNIWRMGANRLLFIRGRIE